MTINPSDKLPPFLGKYYAINQRNIDCLKENKFYVAQGTDFNDLFDCTYRLFNHNSIKRYRVNGKVIENINGYEKDYIELQYRNLNSKFGIFCTSNEPLNPLMWGYYSNNEGYYIEYDYNKGNFKGDFHGPFQITYIPSELRYLINIGAGITDLKYLELVSTKNDIWKDENEYRFLFKRPLNNAYLTHGDFLHIKEDEKELLSLNPSVERFEYYSIKAISRIYLGFNFLNSFKILSPCLETGSCTILNDNPFDETKKSINKLKIELIDFIIEKRIPCYEIIQVIHGFYLKERAVSFERLNFIEIKYLPQQQ